MNENLIHAVQVRLSPSDLESVKKIADAYYLDDNWSAVIRMLIRREAENIEATAK